MRMEKRDNPAERGKAGCCGVEELVTKRLYPICPGSTTFWKSQTLKRSFVGWLMVTKGGFVDGLMVITVASL